MAISDDINDFFDEVFIDEASDASFDFEDVDCEDCGLKFYVRPSLYKDTNKPWPTKCERCRKGLPPLYEY